MPGIRRRVRFMASLAALMIVAACGSSGTPPPASTTTVPTAAATAAPPSNGTSPGTAAEAWDLVWFSDSSAAISDLFAERVRERLGVQVRVHDFWGPSDRGSAVFIADMTEVAAVKQALVDAELIVLYANPARTAVGDKLGEACAFNIQAGRPPQVYAASDFEVYAERLRFIYGQIFGLRYGRTAVIRAVDAYVAAIADWKAAGIERQCTAGWEAWTSVARSVAAEWRVPMASMYDALNGPKHDQDPKARGLIGPDGAHLNDAGDAIEVDVLDALGYQPVER